MFDRGNYCTTEDYKQLKTRIIDEIETTLQVILLTTHKLLHDNCSTIVIHSDHRIFDRGKKLDSVQGFSYLAGDSDFYFDANTSCLKVLHGSIFLDHFIGIMGSQFRQSQGG